MQINTHGGAMDAKVGDRTKFCWNCDHWTKDHSDTPCKTCFGTKDVKYFCYKNWKEGEDYGAYFKGVQGSRQAAEG